MPRLSWTKEPVDTANTSRDGSGTLVLVLQVTELSGSFVDTIKCFPLGTNVKTVGVLIGNNGDDIANPENNFVIGEEELPATTLGAYASTDAVAFSIGCWFPVDFRVYALVHDNQAAGRQFIAFSDNSYQVY